MSGALYLAWRYVAFHRFKTAILVTSITLILYLPVGLRVLVDQSSRQLTARAEATPLLVGARGSPLELVLNTLYYRSEIPEWIGHAEAERIAGSGLARAIPMYVRFQARGHPIVGTTIDYFELRGLRVEAGRSLALLGECVLGARAAESLAVGPDDAVISSPESVFDLAGVYPLKMRVVGVLAEAGGPDDDAVFVDLKTAWIIEGLGHGHQDLSTREAVGGVLAREGNRITANASVVTYNDVTDENRESFHFHGDLGGYPLTAVIAVPGDARAAALLQGRYTSDDVESQIVRPDEVMGELLDTVLTVQQFVVAGAVIVGAATLATAALVFLLSLRLRRREVETLFKIGGSRAAVGIVMASEIVFVLGAGTALAAALTFLTTRFGSLAVRTLINL